MQGLERRVVEDVTCVGVIVDMQKLINSEITNSKEHPLLCCEKWWGKPSKNTYRGRGMRGSFVGWGGVSHWREEGGESFKKKTLLTGST